MELLRRFAKSRPLAFVIALAIAQPLSALPCVAIVRVLEVDLVPLRLIIPAMHSVAFLWLVVALGWRERSGLTREVRCVHLLWYPALVAFAPVLAYGTIAMAPSWIAFYAASLLFTGISEEVFARGITLPVLARYGRWAAVLIAAVVFSAGHVTNAFFEDFGWIEWVDKLAATFGFAVLYGALFLRTGNLWPLIFLHAIHDFSYLTSGTAGPFTTEAMDLRIHMGLSALNAFYGLWLLAGVEQPGRKDRGTDDDAARSTRRGRRHSHRAG